ncbi:hypothetical protein [Geminocystis sp. CENA526]|uniref:hypothetical protein n=1 Tax=Geminocystis sp. CENA526 TaxID=1355871 RepID=UPI003D6EC7CD
MEIEQKLREYSVEDKQWLLEELHKHLDELKENQYRQQAKDLITETLNEVQNMPDDCYEEIWQKFDDVCSRITANIDKSDLL